MRKLVFICLALVLMMPGLAACGTPAVVPVTDISEIMDKIPYSFLEKYNIYFGDLEQAREFYNSDIKSVSGWIGATKDQQTAFQEAWSAVSTVYPGWSFQSNINHGGISALTGFDEFGFDRAVLITSGPPASSWLAEGNFNTSLIKNTLAGQGYAQQTYGKYTYMTDGGDFSQRINTPLGKASLAALDRVAPLSSTMLVTAPATSFVTGVVDTVNGKSPSIMDNEACKALIQSLGEPLIATISLPDKLIVSTPDQETRKQFDFSIPDDWGVLKGYTMAAVDYRADAESYYIDMALYYTDKVSATDDADTIMTRMRHYTLNTWLAAGPRPAFDDVFNPITNITKIGNGYVLMITCRYITPGQKGGMTYIGGSSLPVRDLLFLAIHPEDYIK